MCWTFKKECLDCKYYKSGKCTHKYYMYCEHSELWTPIWFDKYDRLERGESHGN